MGIEGFMGTMLTGTSLLGTKAGAEAEGFWPTEPWPSKDLALTFHFYRLSADSRTNAVRLGGRVVVLNRLRLLHLLAGLLHLLAGLLHLRLGHYA